MNTSLQTRNERSNIKFSKMQKQRKKLTLVLQLFLLFLGLALELLLSQAGAFPSLHHASSALGRFKRLAWVEDEW